jgi:hypothetical protein
MVNVETMRLAILELAVNLDDNTIKMLIAWMNWMETMHKPCDTKDKRV